MAECEQCQKYQEALQTLSNQIQKMHDERYELLSRVYPYMANELDMFRQQAQDE